MLRIYLLAITGILSLNARSQGGAPVNVSITDINGKPVPGERVYFKPASGAATFNAVADSSGTARLELPAGDTYIITIKDVTDTTKYGRLAIPILKADEMFKTPYTVNIRFRGTRSYVLKNVRFESGKTTLRPESFPALDELCSTLKTGNNRRIEIGGHTDSRGRDSINLRISQQRADAIKDYLVKKGIQPDRIFAKGYGSSEPIESNETEEGRQANRRTEVRFY